MDKTQSNLIHAKVSLSEAKAGITVQISIPELGIKQAMTTDASGIAETTNKVKKLQRRSPEVPKLSDITLTSDNDRINEQN